MGFFMFFSFSSWHGSFEPSEIRGYSNSVQLSLIKLETSPNSRKNVGMNIPKSRLVLFQLLKHAEISWQMQMCPNKHSLLAELQTVNKSTKQPAGIVYPQLKLTMHIIHQSAVFHMLLMCGKNYFKEENNFYCSMHPFHMHIITSPTKLAWPLITE